MPKRRRTDDSPPPEPRAHRSSKRARLLPSRLLSLPEELLLRILHHLRPASLLTLSLTSRKLYALSSDAQLWKALFWKRFVQPYVLKHGGALVAPPANAAAGNLSLREWQLWLDD